MPNNQVYVINTSLTPGSSQEHVIHYSAVVTSSESPYPTQNWGRWGNNEEFSYDRRVSSQNLLKSGYQAGTSAVAI